MATGTSCNAWLRLSCLLALALATSASSVSPLGCRRDRCNSLAVTSNITKSSKMVRAARHGPGGTPFCQRRHVRL